MCCGMLGGRFGVWGSGCEPFLASLAGDSGQRSGEPWPDRLPEPVPDPVPDPVPSSSSMPAGIGGGDMARRAALCERTSVERLFFSAARSPNVWLLNPAPKDSRAMRCEAGATTGDLCACGRRGLDDNGAGGTNDCCNCGCCCDCCCCCCCGGGGCCCCWCWWVNRTDSRRDRSAEAVICI